LMENVILSTKLRLTLAFLSKDQFEAFSTSLIIRSRLSGSVLGIVGVTFRVCMISS
ncbi:hypothetical protein OS493_035490, partial [Desmophyllum pertusum]